MKGIGGCSRFWMLLGRILVLFVGNASEIARFLMLYADSPIQSKACFGVYDTTRYWNCESEGGWLCS